VRLTGMRVLKALHERSRRREPLPVTRVPRASLTRSAGTVVRAPAAPFAPILAQPGQRRLAALICTSRAHAAVREMAVYATATPRRGAVGYWQARRCAGKEAAPAQSLYFRAEQRAREDIDRVPRLSLKALRAGGALRDSRKFLASKHSSSDEDGTTQRAFPSKGKCYTDARKSDAVRFGRRGATYIASRWSPIRALPPVFAIVHEWIAALRPNAIYTWYAGRPAKRRRVCRLRVDHRPSLTGQKRSSRRLTKTGWNRAVAVKINRNRDPRDPLRSAASWVQLARGVMQVAHPLTIQPHAPVSTQRVNR
jgi:hypothetical protein